MVFYENVMVIMLNFDRISAKVVLAELHNMKKDCTAGPTHHHFMTVVNPSTSSIICLSIKKRYSIPLCWKSIISSNA